MNSLLAKIDELKIFLHIIEEQGIIFDAICIQESHLDNTYTSTSAIISLENYKCIPQGKYCGNKGGLVTYIKSEYDTQVLDICPQSDIWEGLFIDIKNKETESHHIVGNIYKPPRNNNNNTNITRFINELTPILKTLDEFNCDIALAGDYNINLLQLDERQKYSDFFMLCSALVYIQKSHSQHELGPKAAP